MSKVTDKLNTFVRNFRSLIFSSDAFVLFFCKICQKSVNFEKMYLIVVNDVFFSIMYSESLKQ
jgi:hypothetical protein